MAWMMLSREMRRLVPHTVTIEMIRPMAAPVTSDGTETTSGNPASSSPELKIDDATLMIAQPTPMPTTAPAAAAMTE